MNGPEFETIFNNTFDILQETWSLDCVWIVPKHAIYLCIAHAKYGQKFKNEIRKYGLGLIKQIVFDECTLF